MQLNDDRALVLLSGGQDSSTCLAWALARFAEVETIGFDYGQRHAVELTCRKTIRAALADPAAPFAARLPGRLGEDHMLELSALGAISDTAMTREIAIVASESGLPNTFVPGRNLLFLTVAGALAYRRGIQVIVTGVCETDFSGYPDCRDDTMKAMQLALNLGLERRLRIETPLMWIDKAQTWQMAQDLGGAPLVELIVQDTHTCYQGTREVLHDWGYGCGTCPACDLRAKGWQRWQQTQAAG